MLYTFICHDVESSLEKRLDLRVAHRERLLVLQQEGRLVLAGPHPAIDSDDPGPAGFSGGLIVAEFESLESAQAWIDADPYMTQGVFDFVTVKPFDMVFPT